MAKEKGWMTGHDEKIGKNDFAGLPSESKMSLYSKSSMIREGKLDDTMGDIDELETQGVGKVMSHLSNQK